jgi:hypothetical protein
MTRGQTRGTSWQAAAAAAAVDVVVVVVVVVVAAVGIPHALLASCLETAVPKPAEKAHNLLLLLDRGHADEPPSAVQNETEPRAPPHPPPLATALGSKVAAESEAGPNSTAVAEADPGSMKRSAGAGPHSKVAAAAGAGPESLVQSATQQAMVADSQADP